VNPLNMTQKIGFSIERNRGLIDDLRKALAGKWKLELVRDGKTIHEEVFNNGIVDVGMNSLLDVYFRNQTQIAAWYIGLVDNAGFSAFAPADTMGSHAGWTESTAYSDANRITWSPGAAASRSITNGTPGTFNINGAATLKGIFITSNNTKGGTTGTLWSTAAFASTVTVANGDQLKVTYTLSG
jgi:hypothetical protein